MCPNLNKSNESSPLYAQVAEDIRFKIHSQQWGAGDKIPPELDLCEIYDVSRITIRTAIDELVREGLLVRERAKGTFVSNPDRYEKEHFTFVKSFTTEMKELGKTGVTLKASVNVIKADKKLSNILHLNIGDSVLELKRLRGTDSDESPFAYFISYIPYQKCYSLDSESYYGSFYEYLKKFGIIVNQQREYIEAILPNDEVQKELHISSTEPVLKRVRTSTQTKSSFYEYSECFYIGSRYRYYVEIDNKI